MLELANVHGEYTKGPSKEGNQRKTTPAHNYLAPNQSTKSIKDILFPYK